MGYAFGRSDGVTGTAVTAAVAQTSSAQAALTAAAAAGGTPTKTEFDKVVADAVAARTVVNQLVVDMANSRVFENALRTSLRSAAFIA